MSDFLSFGGVQLRAGMRIDWYVVERRARNWGKGRSKASARRRRERAKASLRRIVMIDPATRTITYW